MNEPLPVRKVFHGKKVLALVVLGLCEFVRGALLFFILPIYVRVVLDLSPGVIGYAMAAHYAMDTSLRSPSGWFTDRFGQRKVLLVTLTVGLVGLLFIIQANQDFPLILGSAMLGMAMASVWPGVISRVTASLSAESHATAMSGVIMAWLVGAGSGMVSMSWLLDDHVRSGFASLLALWFGSLVLSMIAMQGRAADSHHSKVRLRARNVWREVYSVRLLFPGMFVQTFAIGLLLPVLVLYARYELGLSGRMYSYLLIAGGAGTVVLQIPFGRLVDRFGYKRFLVPGFALSSVMLVLMVQTHVIWLVFASVAGLGFAYALILPSWNSVLARSVSDKRRAVMWGVFMTVEGFGMALGPLAGSQLWQNVSPHSPFYAASAILLGMTVFYTYAPLERVFFKTRPSNSLDNGGETV